MQKIIFICLYIFLFSTVSVANDTLKPNYSFTNVSINHLDWSKRTAENTSQKDFTYLEVEGGAGWDWGEFYMFLDVENPTKSYDATPAKNMRFAFKPVLDIKLKDKLALYIQDYNLRSKSFYTNNLVVGLSYKFIPDADFWIKPFIGSHYQTSTYYSGLNGYMIGWVFNYNIKLKEQKFSLAQWHESTFNRNKEDGYGNKIGHQGALSFWWHPISSISTGLQYRYARYELGSSQYQDGLIYSVKYNF